MSAYCPTCRTHFVGTETPPYAVIHRGGQHLHALTREDVDVAGRFGHEHSTTSALADICRHFCVSHTHDDACIALRAAVGGGDRG